MTFTIPCTGDVVAGDTIEFTEAVFAGSFRKPKYVGERVIQAEVVRDSYGADKQQHTFTLKVLASSGAEALAAGTVTTRKGRNVYRNGNRRAPWTVEADRRAALDEKHARGDLVRADRASRKGAF